MYHSLNITLNIDITFGQYIFLNWNFIGIMQSKTIKNKTSSLMTCRINLFKDYKFQF